MFGVHTHATALSLSLSLSQMHTLTHGVHLYTLTHMLNATVARAPTRQACSASVASAVLADAVVLKYIEGLAREFQHNVGQYTLARYPGLHSYHATLRTSRMPLCVFVGVVLHVFTLTKFLRETKEMFRQWSSARHCMVECMPCPARRG